MKKNYFLIPGVGHLPSNDCAGAVHCPSWCLPAARNLPFLSKNANVQVYSGRGGGGVVTHGIDSCISSTIHIKIFYITRETHDKVLKMNHR